MAKQINKYQLQASLTRAKQYIDGKGGAMVYRTETTLWEGTGRNGQTINLSSSVRDFDEITIYTVKDSGDLYRQWQALTVRTSDIVAGKGVIFYAASGDSSKDWIRPIFQTDTTVKIEAYVYPSTQPNVYNTITRIVGTNYTPLQNYSTTEQVIGTWTDGRPVYQKTVTINITASAATSSEREIGSLNVADLNIDKIIYSEAVLLNTSNSNFNQMPVATIASGVNTFTRLYYLGSEQKLQVLSTGISYAVQQVIATIKYVKAP